jgi:hypothetical protein
VASSVCPAGIDFAGVHDSFWTHAGTVERMNDLLREKFIELHSQVGVGWVDACGWDWPGMVAWCFGIVLPLLLCLITLRSEK